MTTGCISEAEGIETPQESPCWVSLGPLIERWKIGRDTSTLHGVTGLHPPSFLPPSMHMDSLWATRLTRVFRVAVPAVCLSWFTHESYFCVFVSLSHLYCLEIRPSKDRNLVFFLFLLIRVFGAFIFIQTSWQSACSNIYTRTLFCTDHDYRLAFIKTCNWLHMAAEYMICVCSLTRKVQRGIAWS